MGFTLVELLMSIAILAILVGSIPAVLSPAFQQIKVERTRLQLIRIRKALVGDSSKKVYGNRTEFGYLGDQGSLPSNLQGLQALLTQPAGIPLFDGDVAVRFGRGWNGPYLETGDAGLDWTKDAWGNTIQYVSSVTPATVTSYGSDGAAGGSGTAQDLVVQIPGSVQKFTLFGFVEDSSGNPYSGSAEVVLNDLDGLGAVSNPAAQSLGSGGSFSFSNVSMGRRSVVVYLPNVATATTVIGPVTVIPNSSWVQIPAGILKTP